MQAQVDAGGGEVVVEGHRHELLRIRQHLDLPGIVIQQ
jgi:hypothetical protein